MKIFSFSNVNYICAKEINDFLSSSLTTYIGKYLMVLIIHKMVKMDTYAHLVEKTSKCLSFWKVSSLSFLGHLTLTKAVLEVLPSYIMRTTFLPDNVCKSFERKNPWLSFTIFSLNHKKVHMVWSDINCEPNIKVGFGLHHIQNT